MFHVRRKCVKKKSQCDIFELGTSSKNPNDRIERLESSFLKDVYSNDDLHRYLCYLIGSHGHLVGLACAITCALDELPTLIACGRFEGLGNLTLTMIFVVSYILKFHQV